jgi:urease accessory protein
MTRPADALLSLLHLCDSLFPIGSFAYSDGLESAAVNGFVTSVAQLSEWLDACRDEAFGRTEGPAIALAWPALKSGDWDAVVAIDQEITALRSSSSTRLASRSMGLRMVKTWQTLHPDAGLEVLVGLARSGRLGPALPIAFTAVGRSAGLALRDTLTGYAYTRLASTVSAAMRLVSIGQTDAHRLLSRALDQVPATVDAVMTRQARPESFAPAFDIAQMTQQYVHSRLFRS